MKSTFALLLTLVAVLALVGGCTAVEKFLGTPEGGGDSQAVKGAKYVAPVADSFVPGLGEAILGAAMLAQNIFLIYKKRKNAKTAKA